MNNFNKDYERLIKGILRRNLVLIRMIITMCLYINLAIRY